MATEYDLAQSFYIDSNAVEQAGAVHITSVDLFFSTKPDLGKSKSGIYAPGVTVYICPLSNDQPQLEKTIQGSRARQEWSNINTNVDSSTLTKFTFTRPILVATNSSYCFLVKFDGCDDAYKLWRAETGEKYLNTNVTASPSSGYNDGNFYKITNGSVQTKSTGADLKFNLNIAKFNVLTNNYKFNERNYELFNYYTTSLTGDFKTGEYVYKNTSPVFGNAVISSTSYQVVSQNGANFATSFSVGSYVVFSDGSTTNTAIRTVTAVNSSVLTVDELIHFSNSGGVQFYNTAVGKVYLFDKVRDTMVLTDSNANSTVYFANNDYIKSEDSGKQLRIQAMSNFDIGRATSQLNVVTPPLTSANIFSSFSNSLYSSAASLNYSLPSAKRIFINDTNSIVGSRSLVLSNTSASLATGNVTIDGTMTFSTSNKYTSPYIEEADLDLILYRYDINNSATNEELGTGNSYSRYISRPVILGNSQDAEDLHLYTTAYIPAEASIKIYGKVVNNNDFENEDTKNWTPLEEINAINYASSPVNKNDVIQKEFRIPYYHSDETSLAGYGRMVTPNTTLSTSNDLSGNVTVNSTLVRVYPDGTPNSFFVALVTSANSTALTLSDTISNTTFNSTALKIQMISNTNKHSAFINPQNKNIIRYYNNVMAPMDTYKRMRIKVVFLSAYTFKVPLLKDIRAVAITS